MPGVALFGGDPRGLRAGDGKRRAAGRRGQRASRPLRESRRRRSALLTVRPPPRFSRAYAGRLSKYHPRSGHCKILPRVRGEALCDARISVGSLPKGERPKRWLFHRPLYGERDREAFAPKERSCPEDCGGLLFFIPVLLHEIRRATPRHDARHLSKESLSDMPSRGEPPVPGEEKKKSSCRFRLRILRAAARRAFPFHAAERFS